MNISSFYFTSRCPILIIPLSCQRAFLTDRHRNSTAVPLSLPLSLFLMYLARRKFSLLLFSVFLFTTVWCVCVCVLKFRLVCVSRSWSTCYTCHTYSRVVSDCDRDTTEDTPTRISPNKTSGTYEIPIATGRPLHHDSPFTYFTLRLQLYTYISVSMNRR